MKNIFTKIEFHYSFLIVALGLVITGYFSNLIIFTSLILVHEIGHIIAASMFKYNVKKIVIYPYGGLTKFDNIINTNIYKDLVVAVSGVIMQLIYVFVIYIFYCNGIIRDYTYNLFLLYHRSMMIFNLLPIIPLDGFKILNLIFSKIFSFNLSNYLSVFISLCTIVIFLFCNMYEKNYSLVLVVGVLMQNIFKFYYQIKYIYNRFLLERYLYNINYKSGKIIYNENKMYKNSSHLIIKDGKIMKEKEFLYYFFGKI
jgi:stage IV sporulation protein FB